MNEEDQDRQSTSTPASPSHQQAPFTTPLNTGSRARVGGIDLTTIYEREGEQQSGNGPGPLLEGLIGGSVPFVETVAHLPLTKLPAAGLIGSRAPVATPLTST